MNVEVYADIVCPFAYVGLTRLLQERTRRARDDVKLTVLAWPLEIVNAKPSDAHHMGANIEAIRRQMAPDLFTGFDENAFPESSIPALALTAAAYEVGPKEGEAVAFEMRRLLFEVGTDIGDPAVLAEVADRFGIPTLGDAATVRAEHARGVDRGVIGSPHFFVGDESIFCPSLDITRIDGELRVRVDEAKLAELLRICFS